MWGGMFLMTRHPQTSGLAVGSRVSPGSAAQKLLRPSLLAFLLLLHSFLICPYLPFSFLLFSFNPFLLLWVIQSKKNFKSNIIKQIKKIKCLLFVKCWKYIKHSITFSIPSFYMITYVPADLMSFNLFSQSSIIS